MTEQDVQKPLLQAIDQLYLPAVTASGPTAKDRGEADRRNLRNTLLLSLHRVAITELPQFEDLPFTPELPCSQLAFDQGHDL